MKWGATKLNVVKDTYTPPVSLAKLNTIDLLPGLDNITPASVIQQGGRERYQVSFSGWANTYAEYEELLNDHINLTPRVFEGAYGFSQMMIISDLQPGKRNLIPAIIEYSITLVEV